MFLNYYSFDPVTRESHTGLGEQISNDKEGNNSRNTNVMLTGELNPNPSPDDGTFGGRRCGTAKTTPEPTKLGLEKSDTKLAECKLFAENRPILCCNPDGSGGGSGYKTVSSLLNMAIEKQRSLIKEQKLWVLRAEMQSPSDALLLAEKIRLNRIFIETLHRESFSVILADDLR